MSFNDNQLNMLDCIIKQYGNDDVDEHEEHKGESEREREKTTQMLIHETNSDVDGEESNEMKEKKLTEKNNSTAFKKLYY